MRNRFVFCIILVTTIFSGRAQNCTLDISGKNTDLITEIFQLNEEQIGTMETLRGEFEVTKKTIEDQIAKLLAEHPQSKEADLITMGEKYSTLQQKLVDASYENDKKFLSTFNVKQYERYLQLCKEAIRRPIRVVPKNYEADSKE